MMALRSSGAECRFRAGGFGAEGAFGHGYSSEGRCGLIWVFGDGTCWDFMEGFFGLQWIVPNFFLRGMWAPEGRVCPTRPEPETM